MKKFRRLGNKRKSFFKKKRRSGKKVDITVKEMIGAIVRIPEIARYENVISTEFQIPNGRRLDVMVVPISQKRPIIGVEIKATRSDFKQDIKWQDYIPYTNIFFFCSPAKVVKPDDLPDDIGLIWVYKPDYVRVIKRCQPREISDTCAMHVYRRMLVKMAYKNAIIPSGETLDFYEGEDLFEE